MNILVLSVVLFKEYLGKLDEAHMEFLGSFFNFFVSLNFFFFFFLRVRVSLNFFLIEG